MAEGFLKAFDDRLQVYSAGTKPSRHVHPKAVQVMQELGVDISAHRPKSVEKFLGQEFDYVITVCDSAKENCPVFIGKVENSLHIGFEDPAAATGRESEIDEKFRKIRDEILLAFFAFYRKQVKTRQ